MTQSSVPGKIILFGEHAVVYGHPAIAAPVSTLRARVSAEPADPGAGLVVRSPRQEIIVTLDAADAENSIIYACQLTLQALNISALPDITLDLTSDIPIGRGLGSGAAVCTAVVRGLCAALGRELSDDDINALVYEVEKKHHGTPSGIDNTVIVYEKPIFFERGKPIQDLHIGRPFTLLIADTGYGTRTSITVGDVRRLYETQPERIVPIFERIGEIVRSARQVIENGKTGSLGALMNENHDLLQRLTVSSVELDVLCEAALLAGAMGAKMSGGGRGGHMLALVTDSTAPGVIKALHSAGAVRVVKTRIRELS